MDVVLAYIAPGLTAVLLGVTGYWAKSVDKRQDKQESRQDGQEKALSAIKSELAVLREFLPRMEDKLDDINKFLRER